MSSRPAFGRPLAPPVPVSLKKPSTEDLSYTTTSRPVDESIQSTTPSGSQNPPPRLSSAAPTAAPIIRGTDRLSSRQKTWGLPRLRPIPIVPTLLLLLLIAAFLARFVHRPTCPTTSFEQESMARFKTLECEGHRGYGHRAAHNSMSAFAMAAEDPHCTSVEFDVRKTSDGVLVVSHGPEADVGAEGSRFSLNHDDLGRGVVLFSRSKTNDVEGRAAPMLGPAIIVSILF